MTKRKQDNYRESLIDFAASFKQCINENMKFWSTQNPELAKGQEMAYSACLFELKEALENSGLVLSDVALADYRVPEAK